MHAALRPYATAGVALVGSSVIAVAPLAPPVPEAQAPAVSHAVVQLTAQINPVEAWLQVLAQTIGNSEALIERIAENPLPILSNIAENQALTAEFLAGFAAKYVDGLGTALEGVPAAVEAALAQIASGDIVNGWSTLVLTVTITPFIQPIFGLFGELAALPGVLSNPLQNATDVVASISSLATLFPLVSVITGVFGPVLQLGVTAQEVYDALQVDDVEAAISALVDFPADLVNTTINGNEVLGTGGLLGEAGIINAVLTLRETIASVITPPPVPPSATMLSDDDSMLLLSADEANLALDAGTPPPVETPLVLPTGEEEPVEELDLDEGVEDELPTDELEESEGNDEQSWRPGQRLAELGDRVEQRFREAEERFNRTIDRLSGREDDETDETDDDAAGDDDDDGDGNDDNDNDDNGNDNSGDSGDSGDA